MFADATTGSGAYTGYIVYRHATDKMEIATGGGTPRLTIESTGAATFSANVNVNTYLSLGTGSGKFLAVGGAVTGGSSADLLLYNTGGDLIFWTTGAVGMTLKASTGVLQIGATAGYTTIVQGQFFSKGGGSMLVTDALSGGVAQHWQLQRNDSPIFYIGNDSSDNLAFFNGSQTNIGNINKTTGVYTPTSDYNKKKDFEEYKIGLDAILGLKPTLYRMKEDEDNCTKHLGFIAQEVKVFIPQAFVSNDDFIGLDYQPIVATLVKAIQELKAEIDELKNK
jgi:hypothetical protein